MVSHDEYSAAIGGGVRRSRTFQCRRVLRARFHPGGERRGEGSGASLWLWGDWSNRRLSAAILRHPAGGQAAPPSRNRYHFRRAYTLVREKMKVDTRDLRQATSPLDWACQGCGSSAAS